MPATVAGASETMRAMSRFFPLSEPLPVPRRLMSQKTPAARKPCGARMEPGISVSLAFMGAIRICLTAWHSGSLPPLVIREVHERIPVIRCHRMLAFAHIEAQRAVHELVSRRHCLNGQSLRTEEPIDGVGGLEHLKLAGWVGPLVSFRGGEQHGPRRAEGHQAILVERQPLRRIVELLELRVEPVREMVVNGLHGFAVRP